MMMIWSVKLPFQQNLFPIGAKLTSVNVAFWQIYYHHYIDDDKGDNDDDDNVNDDNYDDETDVVAGGQNSLQ